MLVLDTDHLVELDLGSAEGATLKTRLEDADEDLAATIISAEEQLRGWLAQIHGQRDPHRQIDAYRRLKRRIDFFAQWNVLPWDTNSADKLFALRSQRLFRRTRSTAAVSNWGSTSGVVRVSFNLCDGRLRICGRTDLLLAVGSYGGTTPRAKENQHLIILPDPKPPPPAPPSKWQCGRELLRPQQNEARPETLHGSLASAIQPDVAGVDRQGDQGSCG